MNTKWLYALLLLLATSMKSTAQSQDETLVAAAVETLRKAMVDADKTALEAITAEGLSYGHSSGKIENRQEFVEALVSGKSDFVTINLSEQTIKIVNDAAIVRHKLDAENNDGGKPGTVSLYILLVWQKQNSQWKLLARQAVKVPK
ncbi:nuclear transport factor 2 family protein [Foetidibacter luteolus]|uniref:nuclear transport factor 2 family protein n=1 Tax=Foetidibacter luteolus TaxID=2608880 RepID=UPI00129BADFF|nr:nuclear transport factor 2 family protein [Foetidibacter luteolus]